MKTKQTKIKQKQGNLPVDIPSVINLANLCQALVTLDFKGHEVS